MRAKVINRFYDKEKKALHEIGNIIEITNERFEKINSASYLVYVEALEETDYTSYTKKELIEMAENKGASVNPKMTKAEIIGELIK